MPFKSEAQRKYLYAKHPSVAKTLAAHTSKKKKLPKKISSSVKIKKRSKVLPKRK